ncbi:pyridoxine 5'-phosphate synthase, partial [Luteibacter rhizovicinus]
MDAGCGGLTVHPRPDMRHVTPSDVRTLAGLL